MPGRARPGRADRAGAGGGRGGGAAGARAARRRPPSSERRPATRPMRRRWRAPPRARTRRGRWRPTNGAELVGWRARGPRRVGGGHARRRPRRGEGPPRSLKRAPDGRKGLPYTRLMPPDEPVAPSPGPRDTGSTATFRAGVEQVDAPKHREEVPAPAPTDPTLDTKAPPDTNAARRPSPASPARSSRLAAGSSTTRTRTLRRRRPRLRRCGPARSAGSCATSSRGRC